MFLLQVWDLHLNDPECRGVHAGDDYVFSIRTNLSDCGTVTVRGPSHRVVTRERRRLERRPQRADVRVYGYGDKRSQLDGGFTTASGSPKYGPLVFVSGDGMV